MTTQTDVCDAALPLPATDDLDPLHTASAYAEQTLGELHSGQ